MSSRAKVSEGEGPTRSDFRGHLSLLGEGGLSARPGEGPYAELGSYLSDALSIDLDALQRGNHATTSGKKVPGIAGRFGFVWSISVSKIRPMGLFQHFSHSKSRSFGVLRGLRTLLGDASEWVCFCVFRIAIAIRGPRGAAPPCDVEKTNPPDSLR